MPRASVNREVVATRAMEARVAEMREVYTPPSSLPDPAPDPDWAFRWIATAVLGHAIPGNVSLKFREGWVPVKAEEQPELALQMFGPNPSGNIEIGGLILCKMPMERAKARAAYYANSTNSQMAAIDNNFMRQNDPRMPLFSEKKSSVSFGNGNA